MKSIKLSNPIKDNRIISSYTYAVRNLVFLSTIYPNIPNTTCSILDEEEYEYLCIVACDLLKYQVETCPKNEKWYFNNLVKDYKDYKDIINWICKNRQEFKNFLKALKVI